MADKQQRKDPESDDSEKEEDKPTNSQDHDPSSLSHFWNTSHGPLQPIAPDSLVAQGQTDPNFMDSAIRFMNRINFDHIPRAQQLILLDSKPMKVWTVPSLSRARTPPLIQHPTTPDGSIGLRRIKPRSSTRLYAQTVLATSNPKPPQAPKKKRGAVKQKRIEMRGEGSRGHHPGGDLFRSLQFSPTPQQRDSLLWRSKGIGNNALRLRNQDMYERQLVRGYNLRRLEIKATSLVKSLDLFRRHRQSKLDSVIPPNSNVVNTVAPSKVFGNWKKKQSEGDDNDDGAMERNRELEEGEYGEGEIRDGGEEDSVEGNGIIADPDSGNFSPLAVQLSDDQVRYSLRTVTVNLRREVFDDGAGNYILDFQNPQQEDVGKLVIDEGKEEEGEKDSSFVDLVEQEQRDKDSDGGGGGGGAVAMSGTPASGGRTSVTAATAIGTRGDSSKKKKKEPKPGTSKQIDGSSSSDSGEQFVANVDRLFKEKRIRLTKKYKKLNEAEQERNRQKVAGTYVPPDDSDSEPEVLWHGQRNAWGTSPIPMGGGGRESVKPGSISVPYSAVSDTLKSSLAVGEENIDNNGDDDSGESSSTDIEGDGGEHTSDPDYEDDDKSVNWSDHTDGEESSEEKGKESNENGGSDEELEEAFDRWFGAEEDGKKEESLDGENGNDDDDEGWLGDKEEESGDDDDDGDGEGNGEKEDIPTVTAPRFYYGGVEISPIRPSKYGVSHPIRLPYTSSRYSQSFVAMTDSSEEDKEKIEGDLKKVLPKNTVGDKGSKYNFKKGFSPTKEHLETDDEVLCVGEVKGEKTSRPPPRKRRRRRRGRGRYMGGIRGPWDGTGSGDPYDKDSDGGLGGGSGFGGGDGGGFGAAGAVVACS